jgi:protoporphyrinogen oxidase
MSKSSALYTRREVLQLAGALTLYLQGCSHSKILPQKTPAGLGFIGNFGPLDATLGIDEPEQFFGDHFTRAHQALWNTAGFLAKNTIPQQPEAKVPVVVIGGGISGLTSAYLLRDLKPYVLEQAPRFGGNSQGQSWRGIKYSIGAAYFLEPKNGSAVCNLMKDIGVLKSALSATGGHVALEGQSLVKDFFSAFPSFRALIARYEATPQMYPEIPTQNLAERKWLDQFDRRSLGEYLQGELGAEFSGNLESWIEHYSWSSFGASAKEISAAAGMNFLAAEFGNVRFFPQGNAGIAQGLLEKLLPAVGEQRLIPEALVLQVTRMPNHSWQIVFIDGTQRVRSLAAEAVVMACPKFVAGKIIPQLEPARLKAIGQIRYRSYLVTNVLIDGKFDFQTYDAFVLDKDMSSTPTEARSKQAGATDIISATYKTTARDTVLTLYQALPYDTGRSEIFAQNALKETQQKTKRQLETQILPGLGIDPARVRGLRIARWGHPMPVPGVGSFKNKIVDILHRPFEDSIFFVHQDNWLLPSLETAMQEAVHWAPEIRKRVVKRARHKPA